MGCKYAIYTYKLDHKVFTLHIYASFNMVEKLHIREVILCCFFLFTAGKICTNPLLHNTTAFPDSVFSGSGDSSNTYKDARITKGGWCPSGSGTTYLLLDLQKEYHITQVVVMADEEQTEWSGSYSLNYSHDTSLKNTEQVQL